MNLKLLYQEMYELTNNDCGCDKSKKYRCCERIYCDIAKDFSKRKYNIELKPVNEEIPFIGGSGCVIDPYLRPICTLHACCISYSAKSEFKDNPEKTKKYFSLRNLILTEARNNNLYPWD